MHTVLLVTRFLLNFKRFIKTSSPEKLAVETTLARSIVIATWLHSHQQVHRLRRQKIQWFPAKESDARRSDEGSKVTQSTRQSWQRRVLLLRLALRTAGARG